MFVVPILLVIDLVSKYFASTMIKQIILIPNFLALNYVKNFGMAWSILSGQTILLSLIAAFAIIAMIYYLLYKKQLGFKKIAIECMLAGAIGNLLDRLFLGYVRDFIDVNIFGYDFPIFNVADCALSIGVIILFIIEYKEERNGKNEFNG